MRVAMNGGLMGGGAGGMVHQTTLKRRIGCAGTGLHSGARVTLSLVPAPADTGIVFRRTDLGGLEIPARWDNVVDTRLCTVVGLAGRPEARIGTVEHLMSALAGAGVDNLIIEIDAAEVPVMDGSAEPFLFLIDCAGIATLEAPRRAIKVLRPVEVVDGERQASLAPALGQQFSGEIAFPCSVIGRQVAELTLFNGAYRHDIARARTFGYVEEVAAMRAAGLARGGSLENAVVIDRAAGRVLNPGGLRYRDEAIRHKLLDAVGDLYLAGRPILGRFHGVRAGHQMHNLLLRALFATPEAWAEVELTGAARALAVTPPAEARLSA